MFTILSLEVSGLLSQILIAIPNYNTSEGQLLRTPHLPKRNKWYQQNHLKQNQK